MKPSITFSIAVLIFNWSLLACNNQEGTDDKTKKMLRDFYTAYITNITNPRPTRKIEKADSILKIYCTENLKRQWQELSKKMHGDLLIDGQFCEVDWLKTMTVSKDEARDDIYTVTFNYISNDLKKQKKVRLGVIERKGVLLIDKIILNNKE